MSFEIGMKERLEILCQELDEWSNDIDELDKFFRRGFIEAECYEKKRNFLCEMYNTVKDHYHDFLMLYEYGEEYYDVDMIPF